MKSTPYGQSKYKDFLSFTEMPPGKAAYFEQPFDMDARTSYRV